MKKLFVCGMLAALASAALAIPSFQGPTGLVTIPTADIVPPHTIDFAVDYLNTNHATRDVVTGALSTESAPARLLANVGNNFEVGLQRDINMGSVNAKWQAPPTCYGLKWAIGARYSQNTQKTIFLGPPIGTVHGRSEWYHLYAVGTYAVPLDTKSVALNVTAGLDAQYAQHPLAAFPPADNASAVRPFGGIEAVFPTLHCLSIAADSTFEAHNIEVFSLRSFVVRYPINKMFTVEAGSSSLLTGANKGFIGVNVAFNTK